MNPDLAGLITIVLYAAVAVTVVLRQALRKPPGWRVWLLYAVNRVYIGLGFQWRANQRCPLPGRGPALILANHRSPLDPLLLWMHHHLGQDAYVIRPIGFLMAKEYYHVPGLIGWISRNMQSIPVDRGGKDMTAVREALRKLKNGDLVGVFPEGKINPGKDLLPANPGIAWLALSAQVPVYPVYIHNAPQGNSMIEPFYNFQRVRLSYGEPVDLSAYHGKKKSQELLVEVTDLLMGRLAELGNCSYTSTRSAPAEDTPTAGAIRPTG